MVGGINSVGLAKSGVKVTAVDKQTAMIEKVQELARKKRVKIMTQISKIQDFQSNTQYDIVLFTHVLHFIPDDFQPGIIQRIIDLAKPGGIPVFADLEDDSPISLKQLSLLENSLKDIEIERFLVKDKPHLGVNYPHQHKTFYLIGIKK